VSADTATVAATLTAIDDTVEAFYLEDAVAHVRDLLDHAVHAVVGWVTDSETGEEHLVEDAARWSPDQGEQAAGLACPEIRGVYDWVEAGWQEVGWTSEDSGLFAEASAFTARQIADAFGVPPECLEPGRLLVGILGPDYPWVVVPEATEDPAVMDIVRECVSGVLLYTEPIVPVPKGMPGITGARLPLRPTNLDLRRIDLTDVAGGSPAGTGPPPRRLDGRRARR
jgi:hypothetical protein